MYACFVLVLKCSVNFSTECFNTYTLSVIVECEQSCLYIDTLHKSPVCINRPRMALLSTKELTI